MSVDAARWTNGFRNLSQPLDVLFGESLPCGELDRDMGLSESAECSGLESALYHELTVRLNR